MNSDLIVLLVEDSDFQREFMVETLKEMGFKKVVEAQDGIEAFKYLQKRKVDLVVSDWEMPNLDGVKLFEKLKSNSIYESIPFILLTTKDEKEKIISAAKTGISHYLLKPLDKKTLKRKLETIFGKG
ncbi:MAG: response regulator [Nitrospina sp.]|jgi:two-component system chemotaxis response regulator CheY|nr:response regulator [Nitrospina sp.]MBT3511157.1 response regulator [Nitrospina sp.]MBT3876052.1 response regulator [Nitrospina sp.]MBT4048360.1 response regulator [Nitrospina sp.]MBT4556488.1 response regulator [Nitrospina sp.]